MRVKNIGKIIRAVAFGFAVVMVATVSVGCGAYEEVDNVLEDGVVEHTLVMYLNANNNLSGYITNNALDAEKGMMGGLPSTRLVIYLDKLNSTTLYEVRYLPYGDTYIKQSKVLKEYPDQVSTTPAVMKSVLEDVRELVPSKSYGLVFAGHGSGWFPKPGSGIAYNNQKSVGMEWGGGSTQQSATIGDEYDFVWDMAQPQTRAMGYDGSSSSDVCFTSTEEFVEGVSPIRFDYIIFDACFMSSIEFLYDLRHVTDYVIASPVEIMGAGLPYEHIVPMLLGPSQNLAGVCAKIVDVYRNDKVFAPTESAAIALVDCSKLEALAESVEAICGRAAEQIAGDERLIDAMFARLNMDNIQVLDRMRPAGFYDMVDFVDEICDDEQLWGDFVKAFDNAVVYAEHTNEINSVGYSPDGTFFGYDWIEHEGDLELCGVSCYVPRPTAPMTKSYYEKTSWARKVYGLND